METKYLLQWSNGIFSQHFIGRNYKTFEFKTKPLSEAHDLFVKFRSVCCYCYNNFQAFL